MANNLDSNFTRKVARVFLESFDDERVITKNVNTQLLDGKFNPGSGDTVDFKRPHDYVSVRTAKGDVSGSNPSDIVAGKVSGVVQNYFTAFVDFSEADEAIKLDQLDEVLAPLAKRIRIDLELDFANYIRKNAALYAGTIGQSAITWSEVALASSVMQGMGVPMDATWTYAANPYTVTKLASDIRSLGAGGSAGSMIKNAHEKAVLTDNFAGMQVLSCNSLGSVSTQAGADRAGTLSANPDVTYATHKDTFVQTLPVANFQASLVIKAGERVTIAGRYMLNQATRQPVIDDTGSKVLWSAVVAADVTLSGTGTGNITVVGPAIYEASGAYNTVDSAPVSGDVITLLGSASTTYQPNLFWHKNAFGLGSVQMKKLYSTDTLATTEDGLQFRVCKYANGDSNVQTVRFDFRPAYATLNAFFAGHGYGVA